MPQQLAFEKYEIVAGGGTKNFATDVDTNGYSIWSSGAVTLLGNVTITDDGAGIEGMLFPVYYYANVNLNGFTLSIFGYALTQSQATNGVKLNALNIGGSYKAYVDANLNGTGAVQTNDIADEAVTFGKMADLARGSIIRGGVGNRPEALAVGNAQLITGDATDVIAVNQTGDGSFNNAGLFAIAAGVIVNADIAAAAAIAVSKLQAMTDGQVITGNTGAGNIATVVTMSSDVAIANTGATTVQTGVITPEKASNNLKDDEISVDVSFVAGSVGGFFTTIAPCNGTILEINGTVTLLIEATNNGTVTPNINGVPVTGGLVTFTAGDALNQDRAGTAITGNNAFTTGQEINLVTAKVTAGGTARMTIKFRKTS